MAVAVFAKFYVHLQKLFLVMLQTLVAPIISKSLASLIQKLFL